MKIEFLFGEVCNFYGDPQNVTYLAQSAKNAEIINTSLLDEPYFVRERPDIVVMASMSESTQRKVIEKLRPYMARINDLINDGAVFLCTGNSCEIFCKKINYVTEEITAEGLGLFDLEVKTDLFARYNGKVLGKADGVTVTGFRSQFGKIYGDNSSCFFCEVERGMGINENSRFEGMRKNNFIGTQVLGPILPLNPEFCEYILRLAGEKNPVAAHKEAATAAFEQRLREFSDLKVKF